LSVDAKEKCIALLSSTTVSLAADANTTLYTVPEGKICVLDFLMVIAGTTGAVAGASPTAKFTVGRSTALTDFLAENTMTNLAATGDYVICRPIPNVIPLKGKTYAASVIIQLDVTTADADGCTDNTVLLFGILYDA
jgi:hypothetical protein